MEDHPLSAVHDCLLNELIATPLSGGRLFHPQAEDAPCRGGRYHMAWEFTGLFYKLQARYYCMEVKLS